MEGEGVISVESHPPVAEIMPQESPEDLGFQETELLSTAIPSSSDETIVLTDDLRDKIIRQVEYYFSDENLPTDKFLMKYVKRDKEGFVPVAVIASFRKMKKLVQDNSMIVTALRESTQLVLSSDGKRVKRIHPLTVTEVKDAKSRTVLVENLLDDYSMENIQRIFGDVGNIKNISICDPHAMDESTKSSKAEKVISSKIHALVEYETVEAAEKAVATLNDEKNWRSGMRVELLLKRMGKYGLAKKGWKSTASEKNNDPVSVSAGDGQPLKSMSHHDETPEQVEEEHSLNERNGQKGRSRGRSRGYKQRNFNGQGHGALYSGPGIEGSKPPPGPRMPDGTRGFTMGRGRSPVSDQN